MNHRVCWWQTVVWKLVTSISFAALTIMLIISSLVGMRTFFLSALNVSIINSISKSWLEKIRYFLHPWLQEYTHAEIVLSLFPASSEPHNRRLHWSNNSFEWMDCSGWPDYWLFLTCVQSGNTHLVTTATCCHQQDCLSSFFLKDKPWCDELWFELTCVKQSPFPVTTYGFL